MANPYSGTEGYRTDPISGKTTYYYKGQSDGYSDPLSSSKKKKDSGSGIGGIILIAIIIYAIGNHASHTEQPAKNISAPKTVTVFPYVLNGLFILILVIAFRKNIKKWFRKRLSAK